MVDVVMTLSVIAGIAVVVVALVFVAIRVRRRGTAGPAISAAMAAYDEAMHSSAHDTFVEVQAQRDRKIAIPAPADPARVR
jgi:hypothetical protein